MASQCRLTLRQLESGLAKDSSAGNQILILRVFGFVMTYSAFARDEDHRRQWTDIGEMAGIMVCARDQAHTGDRQELCRSLDQIRHNTCEFNWVGPDDLLKNDTARPGVLPTAPKEGFGEPIKLCVLGMA